MLGFSTEPFVSRIIDGVSRPVLAKLRNQKAKFITGSVPVVVNQQPKHILGMGWIFDDSYAGIYTHRDLFTSQGVKVSFSIVEEEVGYSC